MAIRLAAAQATRSIPLSPELFGLIAIALFVLLLVVTLSFRNVANQHDAGDRH